MFPDEFYKVPLWNCCRITDKSEIKDAFNVSPMWRLNFFTLINRQSERIGWLQFSLQHMKWLKRAYVSIGNDVPLFCITLQLIWMSWGFCVDTLMANCWEFWSLFEHMWHKDLRFLRTIRSNATIYRYIWCFGGNRWKFCSDARVSFYTDDTGDQNQKYSATTSELTISAIFSLKIITIVKIFGMIMPFSFCKVLCIDQLGESKF